MIQAVRVEGVEVRRVSDGEIVSTPDGMAHYLNAMASLIYELADGRETSSIARSVSTIFDLSSSEAIKLVEQSLAELKVRGLVN